MKNVFNLSSYLNAVQAKSKKTQDISKQIETKLVDENKDVKEQDEITEKQLKKDRKDTEETTIEKKLDSVRTGASSDVLVEKSLNDSKSKIVKHRNEEVAMGNINKLEEKRVASKDKFESEKQEPSSKTEKERLFYNVKSPDGLKLATKKIAREGDDNFDIDWESEEPVEGVTQEMTHSPTKFWDNQFEEKNRDLLPDDELSPDILEELKKFKDDENVGDLENDPDFLQSIFSEEVIGEKDIGGTKVKEVEVGWDLRDEDGDLIDIFKAAKNKLDDEKFMKALLSFINLNDPDAHITEDSIDMSEEMADWTGKATYLSPVK